jgi:D-glycero-D-manno-heptose 1,7-bisphosphate phosphatase
MSSPFVVLDRDGTIIVERNYLHDPEEVELLPNALEGIRAMRTLGLPVVIISNQAGVGRGLYRLEDAQRVNERLLALLAAGGVTIDAIYMCPHSPDDHCHCRKPEPDLLNDAARDLSLDPESAIVVGDKACDVELGKSVGGVSVLVTTGYGRSEHARGVVADYVVQDLVEAAAVIARSRLFANAAGQEIA